MGYIMLTHGDVLDMLPDRPDDFHKGQAGRVLMLCGSVGYTGAAELASLAALRTGAGLVSLGVPKSIYPILAGKLTEAMVFPLADWKGMLSGIALGKIKKMMEKADCIVIGPGLGISHGTTSIVKYVLKNFLGTVILDADGINIIARHKDILRGRKGCTVLTPHEGEFRRLSSSGAQRDVKARELALDVNAIVLLKGNRTVITDGNSVYINPTGNPGMATGGCGDVLAGMIGGLCAQGISGLQAAACAALLHGKAGDLCAEELGQMGMLPTDMLKILPRLLK